MSLPCVPTLLHPCPNFFSVDFINARTTRVSDNDYFVPFFKTLFKGQLSEPTTVSNGKKILILILKYSTSLDVFKAHLKQIIVYDV